MAQTFIYRPDPWPQQPTPHVPIPAQGQTPPIGPTQLAVCQRIIRQAWEPPPPQPYQLPLIVAPLTLKYGQTPPLGPTQPAVAANVILAAWRPPDPQPWQRPPTVPIPAQGQQPPRTQQPNGIVSAWQPTWYPPQTAPPSAAWNVAIIAVIPYAPLQPQILTAWQPPWYPAQSAAPVAPLTLTYGQQPPAPPPYPGLAAWQAPLSWPAQTAAPSAAWNAAVVFTPYAPLPFSVVSAWQPAWYPSQTAAPVAPLTLAVGQQPPPWSTVVIQAVPVLSIPPWWPAQTAIAIVQPGPFVPPPPPAPTPPSPPAPAPLTGPTVIDEDTVEAIRSLWLAADVDPGTLIDQDTVAAIQQAWKGDQVQLPQLFTEPPTYGRAKSPRPAVYATVTCELDRRELAGTLGGWHDYRKVTIRVYGTKPQALQGAQLVLAVFNLKTTLKYPSGASFKRWWPSNEIHLYQDPTTKAGEDVWIAELEAQVWSTRDF